MAATALPLLQDPALYERTCRAVRERAVTEFTSDGIIDRYLQLYSRVLDHD